MNNHQQRTFRWMAGIIALMFAVWMASKGQEGTQDRVYIFPGIENVDIARVHIQDGNSSLSVVRIEQGWGLVGHDDYEVDYASFESLLNNLLEASRSPSLNTNDATPYGLQPPQLKITLVENSGKDHLLKIGNPLQVSTDTYISHDAAIYTTSGNLAQDWRTAVNSIRSKAKSNTEEGSVQPTAVTP